jgi:hypothetical protein
MSLSTLKNNISVEMLTSAEETDTSDTEQTVAHLHNQSNQLSGPLSSRHGTNRTGTGSSMQTN